MNIGERIRARRKELGMTLQEVADLAGTKKAYVWELENSTNRNPRIDLMHGLAKALDVPIEYFTESKKILDTAKDRAFYKEYLSAPAGAKERVRRVVREMLR